MAWVSETIIFEKPSEKQNQFEGNILISRVDTLVFHGKVMDSEGKSPVPMALVKVFARVSEGNEEPLAHTFTGTDGHYLLHVVKNKLPEYASAIIVRVSANGQPNGE